MLIDQTGDIWAVMTCIGACAGEHDIEVVLPHSVFDEGYGTGKKSIGQTGTENTDDFHRVQTQTAGKRIRCITHVLYGIQHDAARFFADPAVAIKDPRHGGNRYMTFFCYIIDGYVHIRHRRTSLSS